MLRISSSRSAAGAARGGSGLAAYHPVIARQALVQLAVAVVFWYGTGLLIWLDHDAAPLLCLRCSSDSDQIRGAAALRFAIGRDASSQVRSVRRGVAPVQAMLGSHVLAAGARAVGEQAEAGSAELMRRQRRLEP